MEEPFFPDLLSNCANTSFCEQSNFTNSTKELPGNMVFGEAHIISIVGYTIQFIFSSICNTTIYILLERKRRFRRSSFSRVDFMLLHLSVADLMVTFLMMPLEIFWSYTVSWKAGDFACRVLSFFRIFGIYLSSFILVSLAVDRFLAVKYPMQIAGSAYRGSRMVKISWIVAGLSSLPQVFIFHDATHPDFPWYHQCVTFGSMTPAQEFAYNILVMFAMYVVPFFIMLGLYCGIVWELNMGESSSRKVVDGKNRRGSTPGLRRSGLGNLERAKAKTIKMTITIVVIFFICWTPYYVMSVWHWFFKASAQEVDQRIQRALFMFASTNSTANPIVYGAFHWKSIFRTRGHHQNRSQNTRNTMVVAYRPSRKTFNRSRGDHVTFCERSTC